MKKISIRTKLTVILSLILILGFLSTNLMSYYASRESLRASIIENSLPLARDNIYSEIQRDLMRPIFVSSLMAHDTFLKDWAVNGEKDLDKITRYLQEIRNKYGFFTSFFISDKTGNYYYFDGILKQISRENEHDDWYFNFKRMQAEYDLDVDTNEAADNHLTVFINHRLKDYAGDFLGVVGVGLDFDRITELLHYYKKKYGRNVYLVSPDGVIQVHVNKDKILSANIHRQEGIGEVAGTILASRDKPAFFEYDADGRHILLTTRFIDELGWHLLVEHDETRSLSRVRHTLIRNLLVSLIITCCTIGITLFSINYFQKKLELLATTDHLTRAYNRNEFENRFQYITGLLQRDVIPAVSILIFDIDRFKQINDTMGHLFGDRVLKTIASLTRGMIRKHDTLVRWGGDEFVILTPSDLNQAGVLAERLYRTMEEEDFYKGISRPQEIKEPVRLSCGIAQFRKGDTMDSLIARADRALYEAKSRGRNRVVREDQLKDDGIPL